MCNKFDCADAHKTKKSFRSTKKKKPAVQHTILCKYVLVTEVVYSKTKQKKL